MIAGQMGVSGSGGGQVTLSGASERGNVAAEEQINAGRYTRCGYCDTKYCNVEL